MMIFSTTQTLTTHNLSSLDLVKLSINAYNPLNGDLTFIEQENRFDQELPLYVDEEFAEQASRFIDEEVSITNAKEVYSCLVQFLEENQVRVWQ